MSCRLIGALLIVLAVASTAHAQEATLDGVELVFSRWMKQHGISRGTLAVAHGDRLALVKGYGGASGERRGLIASLSKVITGACTVTLIQQGKLRFDSTLGDLLPQKYGEPRDPRLRTVTVAQLLTHRTGFGRGESDPATGSTLGDVLKWRSVSQTTMHDLVPGVLRHKLEREPGATYTYTNGSHLLLGIAIEAVTGQSYEDYCSAAVLRPHGVKDARLHPTWHVLGSFGGWSLSGPEYLAFLRSFGESSTFLQPETRQWMLTAAGKETTAGGPVFYSLLLVRPTAGGGHNFWHSGGWTYSTSRTSPSGGLSESIGTLAVSAAFGASWYVSYEPRPSGEARAALDRALYRAVESLKTWPERNLYGALGLQ
jgi:CubicO group peptidase (beta-lactamase class C family)